MDFIQIEIVNWAKYNPRKDRAAHSWFRVEHNILNDQNLFGLSAAQKFAWITLIAEVSKEMSVRAKTEPKFDPNKGVARINLAWFSDQLKMPVSEVLAMIDHMRKVGSVLTLHDVSSDKRLPLGDQPVPAGITTVRNVLSSTEFSGISTKHTVLEETTHKNAGRKDAMAERFGTKYQEREVREAVFRSFPIKRGWGAAWPLIRTMLVASPDQDQLFQDLVAAAKNFTAEMKRLKRPEDKITSFHNWIKQDHWRDYVNPEKNESFDDGQPAGDGWTERAMLVIQALQKWGDWSKATAEVQAMLGEDLWRLAVRANTSQLRQIPAGQFQVPAFIRALKNAAEQKPVANQATENGGLFS